MVSIDILRDGEQPKRPTNSKEYDLLPFRIARHFESFDRVEEAGVRMREEGHVFSARLSPCQRMKMISSQIAELWRSGAEFSWRVHDLTIMPVERSALAGSEDESS